MSMPETNIIVPVGGSHTCLFDGNPLEGYQPLGDSFRGDGGAGGSIYGGDPFNTNWPGFAYVTDVDVNPNATPFFTTMAGAVAAARFTWNPTTQSTDADGDVLMEIIGGASVNRAAWQGFGDIGILPASGALGLKLTNNSNADIRINTSAGGEPAVWVIDAHQFSTDENTATLTTDAGADVTVGDDIHDSATIDGGGATPTGSIFFFLYGPDNPLCVDPIATYEVVISGDGTYDSPDFTTLAPGEYHWKAYYGGDTFFPPAETACDDPDEIVVVNSGATGLIVEAIFVG